MTSRLIWKLLRKHISIGQLSGFFLSSLIGTTIVLLSIQFYQDIRPLFTQGDSFLDKDYVIVTKKVSTLGSLAGQKSTFTPKEIARLKQQPFTQEVGSFTSSQFDVSAGLNLQGGIQFATDMFFESVPDAFVDVQVEQWKYQEGNKLIPIIIPRNYLNLYNFGFAPSRNLPKLSEGVVGMVQLDIRLQGNGETKYFKGKIVGFSNRLNTILVPQSFMKWANRHFAPQKEAAPSRLIIEMKNPSDPAIASYLKEHRYEIEGNNLDAGKATYFLQVIIGIVLSIGIVISALAVYILVLSIFLLLQKNNTKIENLLLAGYRPMQVAKPYLLLTIILNLGVCILSIAAVHGIRTYYSGLLQKIFPHACQEVALPYLTVGLFLFLTVSCCSLLFFQTYFRKQARFMKR